MDDVTSFWGWMKNTFVPGMYNTSWYNGFPFDYDEGFISNRENFLVGMPKMRQVRVLPGRQNRWHCRYVLRCYGALEQMFLNVVLTRPFPSLFYHFFCQSEAWCTGFHMKKTFLHGSENSFSFKKTAVRPRTRLEKEVKSGSEFGPTSPPLTHFE